MHAKNFLNIFSPSREILDWIIDFFLFMYDIQQWLICRPSDCTVSEDAGIEGSNPGQLRSRHWQSGTLTTPLNLIQKYWTATDVGIGWVLWKWFQSLADMSCADIQYCQTLKFIRFADFFERNLGDLFPWFWRIFIVWFKFRGFLIASCKQSDKFVLKICIFIFNSLKVL